MATIYFYVDSSKLNQIQSFGLKLSDNFSHTVPINGLEKRVFVGLLNPKDDLVKYNSKNYTCLKVSLYIDQCYVIDELSLMTNSKDSALIPLKDYIYGTIENPRIVFNTSILPEQIEIINDVIDEPILFDNSKDLFYNTQIDYLLDELEPKEAYWALCEYIDFKKKTKWSDLENNIFYIKDKFFK